MANAANHLWQKAEQSGAFWRQSVFALLDLVHSFPANAFFILLVDSQFGNF